MFYNEEEKKEIKEKWERICVDNCDICHGEGSIKENGLNKICKCKRKAYNYYSLEISNFPINNLNIKKENVEKYIKYDFEKYFNIILNEIFKTKNLFLYNLSLDINNMIISYIGKNLINNEKIKTKTKIKIYYAIYENLIQLSLRSNIDKDAREKLNYIMNKPNVLIIDGIGTETGFGSNSKHNVKLLNLILKERNNRVKSTIISSKLYFDDIEKFYNKDITEILTKFDVIK